MREALRMILTLPVVCLAAGAALAGAYGTTAPIIAEQEERALKEGLARVLPGAASFEPVEAGDLDAAGEAVRAAWRGFTDAGEPAGIVVEAAPAGYGGDIRMLVGVAPDGRLVQMEILSAAGETPGLGSKAAEPAFLAQFEGLTAGIGLVKNRAPSGNEIQAITGATITSQAVLDGVNQALDAADLLQEAR